MASVPCVIVVTGGGLVRAVIGPFPTNREAMDYVFDHPAVFGDDGEYVCFTPLSAA